MGLFAAMGKTRRRLGVLGGMGPAATALFYRELVAHTHAERDQDHIDAVVLSHASLPDRTLVYGHVKRGKPGGGRLFAEASRGVKLAGADVVILGCTELSVYRSLHGVPCDCVDSLDALVRASIAWAGKRYREG